MAWHEDRHASFENPLKENSLRTSADYGQLGTRLESHIVGIMVLKISKGLI